MRTPRSVLGLCCLLFSVVPGKASENLLQDRPNPVADYYSRGLNGRDGVTVPLDQVSESVRAAYAAFRDAPPVQMYDLQRDPNEFANVADNPEYAAHRSRLLAQLEAWRRETNDPLLEPDKLRQLTAEHDQEIERYQQCGYRKTGPWKYHEYLQEP